MAQHMHWVGGCLTLASPSPVKSPEEESHPPAREMNSLVRHGVGVSGATNPEQPCPNQKGPCLFWELLQILTPELVWWRESP
jgi:hypothetical protein